MLDDVDSHDLRVLTARSMAAPYEFASMEIYREAILAREDLYTFRARMLNKYVFSERTIEAIESTFGDYGYEFDVDAGIIYIDES